jgi:hypothetical protein
MQNATTSRPILFSAPMVRAILDGSKTQTRRMITNASGAFWDHAAWTPSIERGGITWRGKDGKGECRMNRKPPHGNPGDQLWVKETWRTLKQWDHVPPSSLLAYDDPVPICYPADALCTIIQQDPDAWGRNRSPIHMPRWASRLTLQITDIRVERLQDISEQDAIAEGIILPEFARQAAVRTCEINDIPNPRPAAATYKALWESINGPSSWGQNPFVWALTFTTEESNHE